MEDDPGLGEDFASRRADALGRAYRAFAPALYSVALHVLGTPADAQDCVHDALVRVWERPDSYRPERGSLRAFLTVCVRNEAIGRKRDAARHFHLERRYFDADAALQYDLPLDDHVERRRLHAALATLPDEQRTALELAYFSYLTHVQIAERLGVPLGTIKSRLSLGLRKLQLAIPAETAVS